MTSIRPTTDSSFASTDSDICSFSRITMRPTTNSAIVCPTPQRPPTRAAENRLLRSLTMVETAARWSASVAWRNPRTKPKNSSEYVVRSGVISILS
ncbi:MAG: hypothetical protein IPP63_10320 [Chloracidobacterium sp.]|nr:hypothetical protein [Chloracidobacterium sp.]